MKLARIMAWCLHFVILGKFFSQLVQSYFIWLLIRWKNRKKAAKKCFCSTSLKRTKTCGFCFPMVRSHSRLCENSRLGENSEMPLATKGLMFRKNIRNMEKYQFKIQKLSGNLLFALFKNCALFKSCWRTVQLKILSVKLTIYWEITCTIDLIFVKLDPKMHWQGVEHALGALKPEPFTEFGWNFASNTVSVGCNFLKTFSQFLPTFGRAGPKIH